MSERAGLARAEEEFRAYLDDLQALGMQLVHEARPVDPRGPAPERFVASVSTARGIRLTRGIARLGTDLAYEAHPQLRVLFEIWANLEWIFLKDPVLYSRRFIEHATLDEIRRLEEVPKIGLPEGAAGGLAEARSRREEECPNLVRPDGSFEHWAGSRRSIEKRFRDIASLPSLKGSFLGVGAEKGAPTIFYYFFVTYCRGSHGEMIGADPLLRGDFLEPAVNPLFPMFEGSKLLFALVHRLGAVAKTPSVPLVPGMLERFEAMRDRWKDLFMSLNPGAYP